MGAGAKVSLVPFVWRVQASRRPRSRSLLTACHADPRREQAPLRAVRTLLEQAAGGNARGASAAAAAAALVGGAEGAGNTGLETVESGGEVTPAPGVELERVGSGDADRDAAVAGARVRRSEFASHQSGLTRLWPSCARAAPRAAPGVTTAAAPTGRRRRREGSGCLRAAGPGHRVAPHGGRRQRHDPLPGYEPSAAIVPPIRRRGAAQNHAAAGAARGGGRDLAGQGARRARARPTGGSVALCGQLSAHTLRPAGAGRGRRIQHGGKWSGRGGAPERCGLAHTWPMPWEAPWTEGSPARRGRAPSRACRASCRWRSGCDASAPS